MALKTEQVGFTSDGRRILRHTDKGGANEDLVVSVGGHKGRRILQVIANYSGAPTQAGVTVSIDSGAGSDYDATLHSGSEDAQSTVWVPVDGKPVLGADDALQVTAPAGGAGVTAAIAVYTEDI